MNNTGSTAYGTHVYTITNPYNAPEIRIKYLHSLIRKLKRHGLMEILLDSNEHLDIKLTDVCSVDERSEHWDFEITFEVDPFVDPDLYERCWNELAAYYPRLGINLMKGSYSKDEPISRRDPNGGRRNILVESIEPPVRTITFTNKDQ